VSNSLDEQVTISLSNGTLLVLFDFLSHSYDTWRGSDDRPSDNSHCLTHVSSGRRGRGGLLWLKHSTIPIHRNHIVEGRIEVTSSELQPHCPLNLAWSCLAKSAKTLPAISSVICSATIALVELAHLPADPCHLAPAGGRFGEGCASPARTPADHKTPRDLHPSSSRPSAGSGRKTLRIGDEW